MDGDDAEPPSPLTAFLSHTSLEAGDNQAQSGLPAVQLMSVHAAKGLEFGAVFITGLEEGLFPHEGSAGELKGLEEERRLMYVAMTRAKTHLALSFAQSRMLHGKTRCNARSRFLDELPADALQWVLPRQDFPVKNNRAGMRPHTPYAKAPSGFCIGQTVAHAKFGEGVITAFEGAGERVQINFAQHGTKWLMLSVAKLEPV